uniref:Uncharacterized protein n=1 Tax=viral metagenome TaxID=1070528 RepID=A0A6C0JS32_9ZZZZ
MAVGKNPVKKVSKSSQHKKYEMKRNVTRSSTKWMRQLQKELEPLKINLSTLLRDPKKYCDNPTKEQLLKILDTFTGMKDNKVTVLNHTVPKYFLVNNYNSCAPDSILFILFFCHGSYFMNKILGSPAPKFAEDRVKRDALLPPLEKLYGNMELWRKDIKGIQKLLTDFINVKEKRIISCSDVKSGTLIWSILADAFPALQFPLLTREEADKGRLEDMVTYIDPEVYTNDQIISMPKHIIYGDDNPPSVRRLAVGMAGLEAVLFFVGRAHYTAAVKGGDDKWYYYDDLRPSVIVLKDPERFIFSESVFHKAQMLFYIL